MRARLTVLALAALTQAGCAGGFRIGGNHYGVGIGAYIGPVPDAIKPDHSYYPPPALPSAPPPSVEVPTPLPPK